MGGGGWCVYLPSPSGLAHSTSTILAFIFETTFFFKDNTCILLNGMWVLRLILKQGLLKHNMRKKYHSGKNHNTNRLQNNKRTLVKIDKALKYQRYIIIIKPLSRG